MKKVTFSKVIRIYMIESTANDNQNKITMKDELDDFLSVRQRNEPNIINKEYYKSSVIEIFKQVLKRGNLIVYGNLGRHPYLLEYYLDLYFDPTKKVQIRSYWWDNININSIYKDDATTCDMLIILEPLSNEIIHCPPYAKSLLVLTSLQQQHASYPTRILFFGNLPNIIKTFKRYTPFKQSNAYTFTPQMFCNYRIPFFPETEINLNLSHCSSKDEIYLCILSMLDCISHLKIKSWTFFRNEKILV